MIKAIIAFSFVSFSNQTVSRQSRNCVVSRYILRPSADHTPRSQAWGCLLWAPRLVSSRKKPVMKCPSCPHPATSGESANLYFHSTWLRILGTSLNNLTLSWGSWSCTWLPSPLWTAAPGAQLKPRAYPLSTPAGECQTSSRLFACSFFGVSAVQFLFKIRKNLQKNLQILVKNFCALWLTMQKLHLPAKTRKHLQLTKFFFSVS